MVGHRYWGARWQDRATIARRTCFVRRSIRSSTWVIRWCGWPSGVCQLDHKLPNLTNPCDGSDLRRMALEQTPRRVKLRKRLSAILPKADLRGRHGEREQDCCGHLDRINRTPGDTRGAARGSAGYHRAALHRIPDDRRTHCIGRTTYP